MQYKIKSCLWFLLMLLWVGCTEKEAPVLEPPTLTANAATDLTRFSVTLSGTIKLSGSSTVKEYGLAYSTVSSMAEENTERVRISYNSSENTYDVKLTGLTPGTSYFYRFYATNGYTEVYSEKLSFTTKADDVPMLDAVTLLSSAESSMEVKSSFIDEGGSTIQQYGFAYKKVGSSSEEKQVKASNKNGSGVFSLVINDLDHSSEYEVRAYAVNSKGTGYSEVLSVSTTVPSTPEVKLTATASSHKGVTLSASIQNIEQANGITEVGFYWGTESTDLEKNGQQLIAKLEGNTFKADLTELAQNTTYYAKAYAINRTITGYSEVANATTARSVAPVLGALTLVTASEKALVIAGSITDKGGHDITGLGYLYQKPNSAEEIRSEITLDKLNTDGTFQFTIADLQPGSTYQVRAFATNQAGTGYSAYASLATQAQQEPTLDVVVGDVTANTIQLTASVTDKGSAGATLAETGFVYSTTNSLPTLLDQKVVVDHVDENFSAVLNNLQSSTTYYIRAYAKNDTKLGYSDVKTVTTTRSAIPTVDKVTISNIAESSVTLTGKVLDTGNNNLTGIGFSYKTADGSEMQVSVSLTALGSDNTFQTVLSGLSANTDYQVRAYATNKEGTGYSSEYASFKTLDFVAPTLTVSSSDVTAESLVLSAVIQSIGKEGATLGEVGFCWSTTNKTPTLSDNVKKVTANGMNFAATLDKLKSETTYYIRAFATNESTVGYSGVITVKTLVSDKPGIDDNPSPEI